MFYGPRSWADFFAQAVTIDVDKGQQTMRFGAHSYVFTDRWSDECLCILEQAQALGLDCVELGVGDDVVFSAALARRRAQELGLTLAVSPGGLWPQRCDLSSEDASDRRAGLKWHKKFVDQAAELGAVAYGGSVYGHTGVVKRRRPPVDEYGRVAQGLHELAEYGAAAGVAIVIEPMSHFRSHVVNTPEQAMRMLALADHPNLFVLLDTYHLVTEITDYANGIRTVGDRLWGIHACENNRGAPGTGILPWPDIFDALAAIGFDGHITLEAYNSSIGDFAYERGMFHNVCPDAVSFVTQSLEFLRAGLAKAADAECSSMDDG